jgi:hypothetical protein
MNLPFDESDQKLLSQSDNIINGRLPLGQTHDWNTMFVIRTNMVQDLFGRWETVAYNRQGTLTYEWQSQVQLVIPTYSGYTLICSNYNHNRPQHDRNPMPYADFMCEWLPYGPYAGNLRIMKYRHGRIPTTQSAHDALFLRKFNEWTAPRVVINNIYDGPQPSNRIS